MPYSASVFDRSGLATLSDLQGAEWRAAFERLESIQKAFLAQADQFRSLEYKWPRDPLHTWSRCWEYPYAYHHLIAWRSSLRDMPLLIDLGSGVTFFPFACSSLGYQVVCTDIDPVCATDIPRAVQCMPENMRSVEFRQADGTTLPFTNEEADVLCCVSVLEHIPRWERTISEVARVLKPGGLFVLTVDVDLIGTTELSPVQHTRLLEILSDHFVWVHPERTVHPSEVLHSAAGPYPLVGPQGLARTWFYVKQYVIKPLLRRKTIRVPGGLHLAVHGMALQKRLRGNA